MFTYIIHRTVLVLFSLVYDNFFSLHTLKYKMDSLVHIPFYVQQILGIIRLFLLFIFIYKLIRGKKLIEVNINS